MSEPVDLVRARRKQVETPEQVDLGYDLADLGSRFTALLIDFVLVGAVILLLWLTALVVGTVWTPPERALSFLVGVLILATFAWGWGYFIVCEGLLGGSTLGKRLMGIRVIHDRGYPASVRGAAIRSILQVVDSQPFFTFLVGGGVMMFHPRTKRLGDLAAGTVVVRDRPVDAGTAAAGAREEESERAARLVAEGRERWSEFERLVDDARSRGLARLDAASVSRFAELYRQTSADLARGRTYGMSAFRLARLERLTGAAHNLLYRRERSADTGLWRWLSVGFPALVRRRWQPIGVAALLLFLPAIGLFAGVRADPALAREVVPVEMMARAEEGAVRQAGGQGYVEVPETSMPILASSIIANNVQVTLTAFAGAILAGLGTVVILVTNGLFLGAVAGLFANHGLNLYFWSFVLPHGVTEMTAIVIGAGGGLWMASAVWVPGRKRRIDALVERGREGVSLLAGAVLLLLIAGVIEGFISPARIPPAVKLSFAAGITLVLAAYLGGAGRSEDGKRLAAEALRAPGTRAEPAADARAVLAP